MNFMDGALEASLVTEIIVNKTRDYLILTTDVDGELSEVRMTGTPDDCLTYLGNILTEGRWARGYINLATGRPEVVGNDKNLKDEVCRRLLLPHKRS